MFPPPPPEGESISLVFGKIHFSLALIDLALIDFI